MTRMSPDFSSPCIFWDSNPRLFDQDPKRDFQQSSKNIKLALQHEATKICNFVTRNAWRPLEFDYSKSGHF